MLKKAITYKDLEGVEITEDFYFNLSKAELIEMNFGTPGGLELLLNKLKKERDVPKIFELFKDIITRSYGEKSIDGKRFVKSQDMADAFLQTDAYSELLISLLNAEEAAKFVNGIIPKIDVPNVTNFPSK